MLRIAGEIGGTFFGYVPDAFSNNLPELPSEESARLSNVERLSRTSSPASSE